MLCTEGRAEGTECIGYPWVIPADAKKPKDARIKSGKYVKTKKIMEKTGMERKPYSAGAVKFSFWFIEFRKTVQLLADGKSFSDVKQMNDKENIYAASSKARAQMIYSTVTARIKMLDSSFYSVFLSGDLATQKMFALVAALAHDMLFFDFIYEVVREKMILGADELTDADIRIFFKNKQAQSEKIAAFQDYTLHRLGSSYKTQLTEAGLLDANRGSSIRKIRKPILDMELEHWLQDHGYGIMIHALMGVR